ncbi:MAG: OB-fold nucleic acid binding domain-containing protein, partial [Pseudomonadota bacterium]
IAGGAFDEFAQPGEDINVTRARLRALLPQAMQSAEQQAQNAAAGINDLFGGVEAAPIVACHDNAQLSPLTSRERLHGEKEALGLYLTGHPIEEYEAELAHICKRKIARMKPEKRTQWAAGMVVSTRIMKSRRGAPMCFLVLDDRSARMEVSLFPECFEKFGRKVVKDEVLVLEGEVQADEFSGGMSLRAEKVYTIAEARQRFSSGFVIDLRETDMPTDFGPRLKGLLTPHRAQADGCGICVLYTGDTAAARIALGQDWQVQASDDLLRSLRDEFGNCVRLDYASG